VPRALQVRGGCENGYPFFSLVVRGPLVLLPVASTINSVALAYRISAVLTAAVNTLGNVEHHLNRQRT